MYSGVPEEVGLRQNARVTDRSGSGKADSISGKANGVIRVASRLAGLVVGVTRAILMHY
jgi:hypothetical protein